MNFKDLKCVPQTHRVLWTGFLGPLIGIVCLTLAVGCEDSAEENVLEWASPNERSIDLPGSAQNNGAGDLQLGAADSPLPTIDSGRSSRSGTAEVGETCEGSLRQACGDGCGIQRCQAGRWTVCEAGLEVCNGHDDDCDGESDEGLGEGTSCSLDNGNGCSGMGVLTCDASQGELICDGEIPSQTAEACDGIDNDCDGIPDEDFPNQRCCTENYHCPPSASCEDNLCVGGNQNDSSQPRPSTLGGACNLILDCDLGQNCLANTCVLLCLDQTDCPGNLLCGCPVSNPGCLFSGCLEPAIIANTTAAESGEAPLCLDSCEYAGDGDCDDGGPNSDYSFCDLGTDCMDCGPR